LKIWLIPKNASENPSDSDKQEYLQNLVATYIQKDIKSLIIEENISGFNNLFTCMLARSNHLLDKLSARDPSHRKNYRKILRYSGADFYLSPLDFISKSQ